MAPSVLWRHVKIWQQQVTTSNTAIHSVPWGFWCVCFPPPHHHHRHPAPTLTEKICVHSCRPARWSESDWRGGRVKTQAGVPFCWPESGSSHVLLQHSQQHHTVRQKVKGRQVISHTHTHTTLCCGEKNPPFFSISLFICLSPHFNPIHRQQRQTNLRSLSSKRREG